MTYEDKIKLANWLHRAQDGFDFLKNDYAVKELIDFLIKAETWVRAQAESDKEKI